MAVAGALLVGACTTTEEPGAGLPLSDDEAGSSRAPQQPDTVPSPPATPAPPAAPPSGEADATEPCDPDQRDALVAAVDGQLEAIASRQWEQALAYATPTFRSDIDSDDFRRIITDEFPVVAGATSRDIGRCTTASAGDEAALVVTVQDSDGNQQPLLYLFEHDAGRWGINGALPATDGSPAPDEPAITA